MDKTTKGKTTIYKTVSQDKDERKRWTKRRKEKRQYNGQNDERKNNNLQNRKQYNLQNLQNRKSRKTDNTMDKTTKGKTTIYKTVSQEGQTIQWTKGRKEKQQSTKP